MALTIKQLFEPVVLGNSVALIYTNPASPTTSTLRNGRVRFTNTSSGPVSITAYAVPLAGAAGAGNCFMNAETLAANMHIDIDLPMLGPGDFISAFASAAASVTMSALDGVTFS